MKDLGTINMLGKDVPYRFIFKRDNGETYYRLQTGQSVPSNFTSLVIGEKISDNIYIDSLVKKRQAVYQIALNVDGIVKIYPINNNYIRAYLDNKRRIDRIKDILQ